MAVSIGLYAVVATQAFPIVAVLGVRGRHPPAPYRRLVFFAFACLLSDVIMRNVALLTGTNLWVPWFTQPVEVGLTLWLLSFWQSAGWWRRAYLAGIPVVLAFAGIMLMATDPWRTFDFSTGPILALVGLVASLHTLLLLSFSSRALLTSQDWFWICGGLSLFWAGYVPIDTFVSVVLRSHEDWANAAIFARAAMLPFSFCLMTWGVICQRPQTELSGHFSAPASR